jgi:hypothetical protein
LTKYPSEYSESTVTVLLADGESSCTFASDEDALRRSVAGGAGAWGESICVSSDVYATSFLPSDSFILVWLLLWWRR